MKNRGMLLESIINRTVKRYKNEGIALMHKINVPIKFASVKQDNRKVKVENAFIASKSTTDYYGLYSGIFLAFEAKSTKGNSLPLSNIKDHQRKYLELVESLGGCAFYIIMFSDYEEFYLLENSMIDFKNNKSIDKKWVMNNGHQLTLIYPGTLNIIEIIEKI